LAIPREWSIYIDVNSAGRVRGESQLAGERQQIPLVNVTLNVIAPGDTDWTTLDSNLTTTNGRVDYMYDFDDDFGVYQFQYIVPPQGVLPVNNYY
jgi:5-hydroxyisourate hydrolase-like protein (transthyretin family)